MAGVTNEMFSARFPVLAGALGPEGLVALLDALEVHEVNAGQALIAEDTFDAELFLVMEGELDVSVGTSEGFTDLGQVRAGSYLGEVSLLDPGPATATVVTEQGCVLLRLSRSRFEELCQSHPRVAAAFVRQLSRTMSTRMRAGRARLADAMIGSGTGQSERRRATDLVSAHSSLHLDGGGGG